MIICVGYDLVEYAPARWNPRRDKRIVHIDLSPAEVDAAYQVAVGVQGGIAASLMRIAERASARQELVPILEEAFRQRVPAVVACPVDYAENLRLTEKLGAWVCI